MDPLLDWADYSELHTSFGMIAQVHLHIWFVDGHNLHVRFDSLESRIGPVLFYTFRDK